MAEQTNNPMTLGQKQKLFARMVPRLLDEVHARGFECTFGDAFRDPRVFGAPGKGLGYGNASSCHKLRLAIDLNLFRDGVFLTTTEAHRQLGEWWEQQHELARWGGRFQDGNHYSFEHGGSR